MSSEQPATDEQLTPDEQPTLNDDLKALFDRLQNDFPGLVEITGHASGSGDEGAVHEVDTTIDHACPDFPLSEEDESEAIRLVNEFLVQWEYDLMECICWDGDGGCIDFTFLCEERKLKVAEYAYVTDTEHCGTGEITA